jgi:hypothetical protein
VLTLVIGPIKQKAAKQIDDGPPFQGFPIVAVRGEKIISLGRCKPLGTQKVDDVEIVVAFSPSGKMVRLRLSSKLRAAIVHFLNTHYPKPKRRFNCLDFVNRVSGIPRHRLRWLCGFYRLWRLPRRLKAGQIVFLVRRDDRRQQSFRDASVYIGYGRFLSVCGKGGDLVCMTLKDMLAWHVANHAVLAVPKKRHLYMDVTPRQMLTGRR